MYINEYTSITMQIYNIILKLHCSDALLYLGASVCCVTGWCGYKYCVSTLPLLILMVFAPGLLLLFSLIDGTLLLLWLSFLLVFFNRCIVLYAECTIHSRSAHTCTHIQRCFPHPIHQPCTCDLSQFCVLLTRCEKIVCYLYMTGERNNISQCKRCCLLKCGHLVSLKSNSLAHRSSC